MKHINLSPSAVSGDGTHGLLWFLSLGCGLVGAMLFFVGWQATAWNIWFWGNMLLLFSNCLYALENLASRIAFLIFQGTFFLFLMARPLVRELRGSVWWRDGCSAESAAFALTALFVGLAGLRIGAVVLEAIQHHRSSSVLLVDKARQTRLLQNLRIFALLAFAVTMIAAVWRELMVFQYMQGRPYEDYYLGRPSLPFPFSTLSNMMPAALMLYLAALPRKRPAFAVLSVYVLSAVPAFLIGARGALVLRLLFSFLYYFLRDSLGDSQRWLGRVEKWSAAMLFVPTVIGLGAYNYLRSGKGISAMNPLMLFVDFFDKQGTSYTTLCRGFEALPQMPDGFRFYTFGWLVDSICHGRLAQALFGADPLGTENCITSALYGHSFAHSASYAAMPVAYLKGHGLGSSFLLESYADFGWIGVIVFSVLLGAVLIGLVRLMHRGWLWRTISLFSLTGLFFVPRAEATAWLSFLLTPHFWFIILCCRLAAGLRLRYKR